jgi:hypothetical protein
MTPKEKLPPVVCEISVSWTPEEAYRRFVDEFSSWWPSHTHSIGGPRIKRIVFETKVGGRIYEEHIDGRRFQWGKVLALNPPRQVRFTFHPSRSENTAQTIEVVSSPGFRHPRRVDRERLGKLGQGSRKGSARISDGLGGRAEPLGGTHDRPNATDQRSRESRACAAVDTPWWQDGIDRPRGGGSGAGVSSNSRARLMADILHCDLLDPT